MAPAVAAVTASDDDDVEQGSIDAHVLVLNGEAFTCGDHLPISTLIRYADNDLLGLHHILVKLVRPEDQERMWDAFEALDADEVTNAITSLLESYADRPTARPTPSQRGSQTTRRK